LRVSSRGRRKGWEDFKRHSLLHLMQQKATSACFCDWWWNFGQQMEVGISVDRPHAFVTDASMWISVDACLVISVDASVWMLS
jgi:hypothetical protein